ncbi:ubiquitin carboxyl-terminal hydrolase isozyme L3, putative [Ixodes scapularis]|uniref:Ubiquitin carboxyl-terminal hydrolase n=1 Tax=Ixodes scapularis TaxID=6945 RepID=B7QHA1_IXOSC|nr:ubiquitin carboxyl-terminal hydrolase isozyme L3, putative [Ixodes scapularis]|eukprot:XP_002414558.1 ubiquitin carboxyl-terminal hydrolase isozyme L3, putative [Ixodes scapularis]
MPPEWSFVDVFGLEPELLSMVPTPVAAVLLLFPYNQSYVDYVEEKSKEIEESGQVVSDRVYFMKQTIMNACGAVALIHSLANCRDLIQLHGRKPFPINCGPTTDETFLLVS